MDNHRLNNKDGDLPTKQPAGATGSAEEWDELSKIVGNWNVLHGARCQADQLVMWRMCATRLREFAIAYRSHPLRNSDDRLDDALAEFDRLDQPPNAPHSIMKAK